MIRQVIDDEPSPAQKVFDSLKELRERVPGLTEEDKQILRDAGHMVNAQEVIAYHMLQSCKKIGFVYDPTLRDGEFAQAWFWLQDKGQECMEARLADTKHLMVKGIEQRIEDLYNFYQESKNAS